MSATKAVHQLDIVARMRVIAGSGSRSDQRIASSILADPDFATHAAIEQLAERAEVSEASVTRFCRALGCLGLRDFKVRLAQAIATTGRYIKPLLPDRDGDARIPQIIADGAHGAIDLVCRTIDLNALSAAAEALIAAKFVRAFGSGGNSSMAAVEMENRLFRLGLFASSHIDGEMQQMTAAAAGPGTAIVAYSVSGENRAIVDAVTTASHYDAMTIAITAPQSHLARASTIVIPFHTDEGLDIFRPSAARYALLAITDMIAMSVAERIGADAAERMRRIKHHQSLTKLNASRLPLGD